MAQMTFQGNFRISPVWAADFGGREHIMPFPAKVDPTQFSDQAGVPVTVTAAAAVGATSISIAALTPGILSNTVLIAQGNILVRAGITLNFNGNLSGKYATLTADAIYGSTTITVAPLVTALNVGDVATFSQYSTEFIPSGTIIGRTYAMRDASIPFRPALVNDDEIFLVVFDLANIKLINDVELYRHRSLVKENYLPGYANLSLNPVIADPSAPPILTHSGVDGSVGAGVYTVGYSFINGYGETRMSPVAQVTKATTEHITIASIPFPVGATGIRYYVSPFPGDATVAFAKEQSIAATINITADGSGPRPQTGSFANNTTGDTNYQLLQRLRGAYECIVGVN